MAKQNTHTVRICSTYKLSILDEKLNIFTSINAWVATENKEPFTLLTEAPHFVYTHIIISFHGKITTWEDTAVVGANNLL